MSANHHAPKWLNNAEYPFKSNYIRLTAGKMHYIDEGKGDLLLFIHGTPTWSFLYRNFIKELSRHYRCIAIDHLGFGLSEASSSFSGTPEDHANNLSEFITTLRLQHITLVVHDFGGSIGLAAGIQHSHLVDKVVLFNSWMWETKNDPAIQKIDKLINGWLGKILYLNFNFSPKVLLKKGFANRNNLFKDIHQHYIKPFPTKASRIPLLKIAQALIGSSDWYQQQWEQLDKLANKNWLILWGMQDQFITTNFLQKWKERLPHAKVKEFNCGHFVQEESTDQAILEVYNFMKVE